MKFAKWIMKRRSPNINKIMRLELKRTMIATTHPNNACNKTLPLVEPNDLATLAPQIGHETLINVGDAFGRST